MSESQTPNGPPRSALVLYGSETGNAQEVAEEVGAMVERLHFTTHVAELNQFKPVGFSQSINGNRHLQEPS